MAIVDLDLRIGRRQVPFEFLLIVAILGTHLFAAVAPLNSLMYWYPTDDAFYYFQVARHITAGQGVTFDGINPANGFHPLWMLICLPIFSLARFDVVLPLRLLVLVMAGLNAASSVLLYRLLKRNLHAITAALAALVWAFQIDIHAVTTLRGMEAGIVALSVIGMLTWMERFERTEDTKIGWRVFTQGGLVASIILFSRLDNVFLVAIAGIWLIFRRGNLRAYLLAYLVSGFIAVVCSFFTRLGFTSEFPQTIPVMVVYLAVSLPVRLVTAYFFGLHRAPGVEAAWREGLRILSAVLTGSVVSLGIMVALSLLKLAAGFPRLVVIYDLIFTLVLTISIRLAARWLDDRKERAAGWKGLQTCFSGWLRNGLAYGLPLAILLGLYVTWNQVNFGTFMPVSGEIKHWWGQVGDTIYGRPVTSWGGLLGFASFDSGPWRLFFAPVNILISLGGIWASIGCVVVIGIASGLTVWQRKSLPGLLSNLGIWPLLAAAWVQVLYYNGTYYTNLRPWYWVNQMLLICLVWAVLGDGLILQLAKNEQTRRWLSLAAALASLVIVGVYCQYQLKLIPLADIRSTYPDLAETEALEKLTEPGSRIGMTGGGVVAYFIHDRSIVNLDGLMNSVPYFQALKSGEGRSLVDSFGLSYVFGGETILLHSNPYYFILANRLEPIAPLGGGYVYRYHIP